MTDTLVGVSPLRKTAKKTLTPEEVERNAVGELVKAARARGDDLTGPDGLLKVITKQVIEAALEEEMTEHVGYDKHAAQGRNGANSRSRLARPRARFMVRGVLSCHRSRNVVSTS